MRDKIVALINAIKKRGRDGVVSVRLSIFKSVAETEWITVFFATGSEFICNVSTKLVQSINIVKLKLNFDQFGVFFQAIAARFIFGVRMNVWVIPIERRFNAFFAESLNTVNATRRTAGME